MATIRITIPAQTFEYDIDEDEAGHIRQVLSGDEDGYYACFPDATADWEREARSAMKMNCEFIDEGLTNDDQE